MALWWKKDSVRGPSAPTLNELLADIEGTQVALLEHADATADANTNTDAALMDLADAVAGLAERVDALEGKVG